MTLTQARAMVRDFARSAHDSSIYSAEQVDRAIQIIGNRFCHKTRALQLAVTSGSLAAGDTSVALDFTGSPQALYAENLMQVTVDPGATPTTYCDANAVRIVDYATVNRNRLQYGTAYRGMPSLIAFKENWNSINLSLTEHIVTLEFFPANDTAGRTFTLKFWVPFSDFTVGTGSPDSVTLNLPDHWLTQILPTGAPAVLQATDPEHGYSGPAWQTYLSFENEMIGSGSLGEGVFYRGGSEYPTSGTAYDRVLLP